MRKPWFARRTLARTALGSAAVLVLSACGGGDSGADSGASGTGGDTLIFGASADPVVLDGAYVSDGESIRVLRQIYEGLVTTKQGSTDVVPALAESWEPSADGLSWTFALRSGVKFHDGEPFDAAAVCFNFDRWYNFTGLQQSDSVSYYWVNIFGGFKVNADPAQPVSLYSSCEAKDESTAVITLSRPSSAFVSALTLPAFSMGSPKALTEFKADEVSGDADAPKFTGTYGTEHPTGTGPYRFDSWAVGDKLTIKANPDYWGERAKTETIVFRPIADGPARRQALESGDIDGYDLVDPADVDALKQAGFQILRRPAFNVGYLGFNQAKPPLDNPKIRQAIAYAINRDTVIKTNYPEGATVATQFQPPSLWGYADDVPAYGYDLAKAKSLVAESGVANPTLEFWYPTDVSRPYMPNPQANFELMKADLEAAGFTIVPKSAPWRPDYLNTVQNGGAAIYLLGWTGDFGDPDNWVGVFFQSPGKDWGFANPAISDALTAAEGETDQAKRETDYMAINKQVMEFLPGLPYVNTEPAVAMKAGIEGFVPSPVQNEDFAKVTIASS